MTAGYFLGNSKLEIFKLDLLLEIVSKLESIVDTIDSLELRPIRLF